MSGIEETVCALDLAGAVSLPGGGWAFLPSPDDVAQQPDSSEPLGPEWVDVGHIDKVECRGPYGSYAAFFDRPTSPYTIDGLPAFRPMVVPNVPPVVPDDSPVSRQLKAVYDALAALSASGGLW